MENLFLITGYWKEDNEEIVDAVVLSQTFEESGLSEEEDEKIFFYGMSEENIKTAILQGESFEEDFVILSYKVA